MSATTFVARALLDGIGVLVISAVLPGMRVKSYPSAVAFAIVVGLLNALVWHVLAFLSVPLTVLTLGLFGVVLNTLVFGLARAVVPGVEISGCITALLAAVGMSIADALSRWIVG